MSEDPNHQTVVNSLRLEEGDIQQLAKFVREFVVMSLIIWMEKCVTDWNEAVSPSVCLYGRDPQKVPSSRPLVDYLHGSFHLPDACLVLHLRLLPHQAILHDPVRFLLL